MSKGVSDEPHRAHSKSSEKSHVCRDRIQDASFMIVEFDRTLFFISAAPQQTTSVFLLKVVSIDNSLEEQYIIGTISLDLSWIVSKLDCQTI